MFEPLLFHLFLLYSSLSIIDGLVKYARCLAIGKICLVIFYLLVETVCHIFIYTNVISPERWTLFPVHLTVSLRVSVSSVLCTGVLCTLYRCTVYCFQVLLSSLAVTRLEQVIKSLGERRERREMREGRGEEEEGMPPAYIVVQHTWPNLTQPSSQSLQRVQQVVSIHHCTEVHQ